MIGAILFVVYLLTAAAIVRFVGLALDRYDAEQRHLADYYTRHPEKRT